MRGQSGCKASKKRMYCLWFALWMEIMRSTTNCCSFVQISNKSSSIRKCLTLMSRSIRFGKIFAQLACQTRPSRTWGSQRMKFHVHLTSRGRRKYSTKSKSQAVKAASCKSSTINPIVDSLSLKMIKRTVMMTRSIRKLILALHKRKPRLDGMLANRLSMRNLAALRN